MRLPPRGRRGPGRNARRALGIAAAWACALEACVLGIGGCRSGSPPPGPAPPSAEAEARALVARARDEVEHGSGVAPTSAASDSAPLYVPQAGPGGQRPLLVFLHGLGGSGATLANSLGLRAFAEAQRFAFMAPDGAEDFSGRRFWNASPSCCNFDQLEVDHIALLRGWITAALKQPLVDPKRVYLIGYSNGGFMAYRAACELGGLLRGIVSIAGAGPSDPKACNPGHPLSVIEIHGDADPIVSFDGGYLFADRRRPRHPSAPDSVGVWAELNGCGKRAVASGTLDLDPRLPGAETEVLRYPGCQDNPVELWRIRGGDHTSGISRYSLQAIWAFIQAEAAR